MNKLTKHLVFVAVVVSGCAEHGFVGSSRRPALTAAASREPLAADKPVPALLAANDARPFSRPWGVTPAQNSCVQPASAPCPPTPAHGSQFLPPDVKMTASGPAIPGVTAPSSPETPTADMPPAPATPEETDTKTLGVPLVGANVAANSTVESKVAAPAKTEPPAFQAVNVSESSEMRPPGPPSRLVNCRRINLNYQIKDVGPSGVSAVELWYTQDGRKWTKGDVPHAPNPPFVVDVKEDGAYGFTLVARNGIGLGKRSPMVGDLPQIWITVDQTKPTVKISDIHLTLVNDVQHLNVSWKAADKNMSERPITISYAERPEGPWSPIVSSHENMGNFIWQMPPNVPHRFLLRVEATDLVGNIGAAQEPVIIDLVQPTVLILGVDGPGR